MKTSFINFFLRMKEAKIIEVKESVYGKEVLSVRLRTGINTR